MSDTTPFTIVITDEAYKGLKDMVEDDALTYDDNVKRSCISDPIINKIISNHCDDDIFTLTIKAHQSNYGEENKFIYWYVNCDIPPSDDPLQTHPFRHSKFDGTET